MGPLIVKPGTFAISSASGTWWFRSLLFAIVCCSFVTLLLALFGPESNTVRTARGAPLSVSLMILISIAAVSYISGGLIFSGNNYRTVTAEVDIEHSRLNQYFKNGDDLINSQKFVFSPFRNNRFFQTNGKVYFSTTLTRPEFQLESSLSMAENEMSVEQKTDEIAKKYVNRLLKKARNNATDLMFTK